ncbi:MAG: ABC transporter substrate-binding protein [Stackebrandtia sp.]
MRPSRTWTAAALAFALAAGLAACSGDDESSEDPEYDAADCGPDASHLEGVEAPDAEFSAGDLKLEEKPERVVSISATVTEMLFAVDAGEQVAAVDSTSNYPEEGLPEAELDSFSPNVEAIVGYDPDLVVVSHDQDDILASLESVGIPVYYAPAALSLGDTYQQIVDLGSLTGNLEAAEDLTAQIDADITEMLDEMPVREERLSAYYELDEELFSLTSDTFAGSLLEMACFENIADEADDAEETGGFPQLSGEFIISSDPDVIFASEESADGVAERDGWDAVTAVAEDNVVALDGDVSSRWGPRVVELMKAIVDAVANA